MKINVNNIKNIKVAQTPADYKTGMKKGNQSTMVFPFKNGGVKPFNMIGMKHSLKYQGFTNGQLTDQGVANPGEYFNVNGDTVVEHRLPKGQTGLNLRSKTGMNPLFDIKDYIDLNQNSKYNLYQQHILDSLSNKRPSALGNGYITPDTPDNLDIPFPQNAPAAMQVPYDFSPEVGSIPKSVPANTTVPASNSPKYGLKEKWNETKQYITPGDVVGNIPLNATFNLGKYLFDKPEIDKPIYNRYSSQSLNILKNLKSNPNLNPILINDRAAKQSINDSANSNSQRMGMLLQQNANTQGNLRNAAFQSNELNNKYGASYAAALHADGDLKQREDLRARIATNQNEATHDLLLDKAVREYDNNLANAGTVMDKRYYTAEAVKMLKDQNVNWYRDQDGKIVIRNNQSDIVPENKQPSSTNPYDTESEDSNVNYYNQTGTKPRFSDETFKALNQRFKTPKIGGIGVLGNHANGGYTHKLKNYLGLIKEYDIHGSM